MNIVCENPLYLNELKKQLSTKNPTLQIITHDDMDGYASAAVVFHAFKRAGIINESSCSCCHYNYSDKIPSIDKSADIVFITDYSISNDAFMRDLLDAWKSGNQMIYWCDHHQTSIDKCKGEYEVLKKIPGMRDTRYCGAALAWYFLNPGTTEKKIPRVLQLVDDFDCWKKKIPESDYMNAAFNYMDSGKNKFKDPSNDIWENLFYHGRLLTSELKYGKTYCEMQKDKDKTDIRRNGWIGTLDKFPNIKMICLNNDSKGSQLFADLFKCKEYPNGKYEYACAFQFNGIKMTYSIYSSDKAEPSAQKICEAYGGGGHPGAAGFSTDNIVIHKVEDIPEEFK